MHVLHVIDGLPRGGAERMLIDIANATTERGIRVSVCVTRSCLDMATCLHPRVPTHVLHRCCRFDIPNALRLRRIVDANSVTILHAHSRSSFALLAALNATGQIRLPILLQDHLGLDLHPNVPTWFRVAAQRFLTLYVGVSESQRPWAQQAGLSGGRVRIVPNGLDPSRILLAQSIDLCRTFSLPPGSRVAVMTGGIRREKGIEDLLTALALRPLPKDLKVLILGPTPDPRYLKHCDSLLAAFSIRDCVRIVGSRADVPAILKAADYALLSSRSESGPLALIEYMLAELPFVATSVGEVARIARESGVAEFVESQDPVAFRTALDRMLDMEPAQRSLRVAHAKSVALRTFAISALAPVWEALYKGLR